MDFLLFLEDFHPEQELKLSFELIQVPSNQLFTSNPSSMVFKHFQDCLKPRKFSKWFLTIISIMFSHQSKPYSPSKCMCFGSITFLAIPKPFWGCMTYCNSLYCFINHTLGLQFQCIFFITNLELLPKEVANLWSMAIGVPLTSTLTMLFCKSTLPICYLFKQMMLQNEKVNYLTSFFCWFFHTLNPLYISPIATKKVMSPTSHWP
jgi:hypothetical protein